MSSAPAPHIATITSNATGFNRIEICDGFSTRITRADSYSVVLTVSDNVQPMVEVSDDLHQVSIGLSGTTAHTPQVLEAAITLPELHSLMLRSGSKATIDGFDTGSGQIEIIATEGSVVDGRIVGDDARFMLSGGSHLKLKGGMSTTTLIAGESSTADLSNFSAGRLTITLGSAGSTHINAHETIAATLGRHTRLACPPATRFELLVRSATAHVEIAK